MALNHDDLGPNPRAPTMLKSLFSTILLLFPSCNSSTVGPPLYPINGTWCPVDSLTEYVYESPLGNIVNRYIPSRTGGGYSLTLIDGMATPGGTYRGLFTVGTDTETASFTLPSAKGEFYLITNELHFMFPTGSGPSWFWEIARHVLVDEYFYTDLNDTTSLPGQRIYLHMAWKRCFLA